MAHAGYLVTQGSAHTAPEKVKLMITCRGTLCLCGGGKKGTNGRQTPTGEVSQSCRQTVQRDMNTTLQVHIYIYIYIFIFLFLWCLKSKPLSSTVILRKGAWKMEKRTVEIGGGEVSHPHLLVIHPK